jgi:hypothetical protein
MVVMSVFAKTKISSSLFSFKLIGLPQKTVKNFDFFIYFSKYNSNNKKNLLLDNAHSTHINYYLMNMYFFAIFFSLSLVFFLNINISKNQKSSFKIERKKNVLFYINILFLNSLESFQLKKLNLMKK